MLSNWNALHAQLLRASARGAFHRHFQTIRVRHPDLEAFVDPAALLDHQHRRDGNLDAKNNVLRALVIAVQRRDETSETASMLVILALWPGLDAIERRRRRLLRDSPGGLAGDLVGRVGIAIARLDLGRVRRIAATLVRNVERDLMRMLQARWSEDRRQVDLEDNLLERASPAVPSPLGLPPDLDMAVSEGRIASLLSALIGRDAPLVFDIAVRGTPQREAAERQGLTYEGGRKRYRRALDRLRIQFAEL